MGDMVLDFNEVIGMLAGTGTTLAFVPQVLKVWRSRSAADISLVSFSVFATGVSLWLVYGLLIGSLSIILANAITLVLALSIVVMKIRFDQASSAPLPTPDPALAPQAGLD